jgi:hypothetical protein
MKKQIFTIMLFAISILANASDVKHEVVESIDDLDAMEYSISQTSAGRYQLTSGQVMRFRNGKTISCNSSYPATFQLRVGQAIRFSNGLVVECYE